MKFKFIIAMSGDRGRRWCFTLNNYTDTEVGLVRAFPDVRYLVCGEEVGDNGTPHLQGYAAFAKPYRLSSLKKLLPRAHWEQSKGSEAQNQVYCKKEGKFFEIGSPAQPGKRNDLIEMKDAIDEGKSYDSLWETNFSCMVRYRNGIREYADLKSKSRSESPRVEIYWGPTGTGKSHRAFSINAESTWVYPGRGWFDGYLGQHVAVFDEFDGSDISFGLWKRLCDKYPMSVPIKGGHSNWNPKVIVFTSNFKPESWWLEERDKMPSGWKDQFDRRVTACEELTEVYSD